MRKGLRIAALIGAVMMAVSISACDITTGASFDLNADNASYTMRHATAFNGCITMQDSYKGLPVTAIADRAFERRDIDKVIFADTLANVGTYAFLYSEVKEVETSASLQSIGGWAFAYCFNLATVVARDSSAEMETKPLEIGESAFLFCVNLKTIEFSNSLSAIGEKAFYGCAKLENVQFGASLESIGEWAFYECASLESVDIPNTVKSIEEATFYGCTSLKKVSLGNQMEKIGAYAFYNCPIEGLVLPVSVKNLGECAFYKAPLRAIYYGGSAEDWARISFEPDVFPNEGEKVYFYSENQPTQEGDWWHYDSEGAVAIW